MALWLNVCHVWVCYHRSGKYKLTPSLQPPADGSWAIAGHGWINIICHCRCSSVIKSVVGSCSKYRDQCYIYIFWICSSLPAIIPNEVGGWSESCIAGLIVTVLFLLSLIFFYSWLSIRCLFITRCFAVWYWKSDLAISNVSRGVCSLGHCVFHSWKLYVISSTNNSTYRKNVHKSCPVNRT